MAEGCAASLNGGSTRRSAAGEPLADVGDSGEPLTLLLLRDQLAVPDSRLHGAEVDLGHHGDLVEGEQRVLGLPGGLVHPCVIDTTARQLDGSQPVGGVVSCRRMSASIASNIGSGSSSAKPRCPNTSIVTPP